MRRWLLQFSLWLGSPRLVAWVAQRLAVEPDERAALAAVEATRRGIMTLYNLRCPLCGTEIQQAWTVTPDGRLGVRRKSLCPACDFRLDCCRHCQHFLLGGSGSHMVGGGGMPTLRINDDDYSSGRCGVYRTYTSVYELYDERTADRL